MNIAQEALQLGEFIDRDTVRYVRDYPHPVRLVWRALIDPKEISVWWLDCLKLEGRAGGRYSFNGGGGQILKGRITAFEPERLIEFSGLTRFELSEREDGCRLVLTLKRWPNGWNPVSLAGFQGWLARLRLHLQGIGKEEADQFDFENSWRAIFPAYEWLLRQNLTNGAPVLYRVHFAERATELSAESRSTLDGIVHLLKERPELGVQLDGFGDDPCPYDESVKLSQERAAAVGDYLSNAGIARDRIMRTGIGNHHWIADRDTPQGRAFNRRVEIRPMY